MTSKRPIFGIGWVGAVGLGVLLFVIYLWCIDFNFHTFTLVQVGRIAGGNAIFPFVMSFWVYLSFSIQCCMFGTVGPLITVPALYIASVRRFWARSLTVTAAGLIGAWCFRYGFLIGRANLPGVPANLIATPITSMIGIMIELFVPLSLWWATRSVAVAAAMGTLLLGGFAADSWASGRGAPVAAMHSWLVVLFHAGTFAVMMTWAINARKRILPPGHCGACGYDLRASTSGVCPECGAPAKVAGEAVRSS